ncbi:PepSY-like domain-containing protein [Flavobacterium sp.]|uniref:PepSY-like domain-containing protein n=1 Tax=Flavobacterium sp. TaxID=239 RepID=UPI0025DCE094|nr:PepSY-like domain-containing protein [Flavobacterium sp.]
MMKKVMMILAMVLIYNCSFAGTPPKVVSDAFAKKFPKATKVSWGKEGPKEWEAEFTLDGEKISANFGQDGTWLETEQEIKAAKLPKTILASVKMNYSDWKIAEADKTETAKHGTIYEVDLKKGLKSKSLAFKPDGTAVKE